MNGRHYYFRVTWRDFSGKTVIKHWRDGSPAAARTRAQNQGSCRTVISVEVISAEAYEAGAKGQRCTRQFLRNTSRSS